MFTAVSTHVYINLMVQYCDSDFPHEINLPYVIIQGTLYPFDANTTQAYQSLFAPGVNLIRACANRINPIKKYIPERLQP